MLLYLADTLESVFDIDFRVLGVGILADDDRRSCFSAFGIKQRETNFYKKKYLQLKFCKMKKFNETSWIFRV